MSVCDINVSTNAFMLSPTFGWPAFASHDADRVAANARRPDHSGHLPKRPQNKVRSPGSSAATRARTFDCSANCSPIVSRQSERSCAIPALTPVRDTAQRIRQSAPERISYSTSPRARSRSVTSTSSPATCAGAIAQWNRSKPAADSLWKRRTRWSALTQSSAVNCQEFALRPQRGFRDGTSGWMGCRRRKGPYEVHFDSEQLGRGLSSTAARRILQLI